MSADPVQPGALRALLVEDNPGDARLLREILADASNFPHSLQHVERLSAALAALESSAAQSSRVDVVLLDLTLPDAMGLGGLRALHAAHPFLPIVVLTGLSDEALALEAVKSGAQDYLLKGEADARVIARSIRYAIERSRSEEATLAHLRAETAHAAALADRARLRALFMQAPVGICVLTVTATGFVFELANARYLQLVGKREVVGKPILEVFPDSAGEAFVQILEEVAGSGRAFSGQELMWKHQREEDGSWVESIVDFVCEPMRSVAGLTASIMVVASDVTDQALARKRVDEARRAAALSEQRFQLLAEAIPQIVWSMSPDGSEAYLSPRWDEYTGQTSSQALAERWRQAIHPEDYDRCFETWAQAATRRGLWQVEYRLRRSDGVYRWHLGRSLPHCDPSGTILRWYGTATDIDEQRAAIRSRDDLLATVSHDLRGPLGVITMGAELLESKHGGERALAAIVRSAKQMERLIQDLLDMASIESGHLSMVPLAGPVGTLVEEAVDSLQSLAAAKSIVLKTELQASRSLTYCDRHRVLQVFSNIVGNAIKFTPACGRISICAETVEDRLVRFAISDSGPGIEPDQLAYVFDRFWQAKETARAGTGLGLAICKGIVQQHGGSIWVESQVGVGTTFFFTLPLVS